MEILGPTCVVKKVKRSKYLGAFFRKAGRHEGCVPSDVEPSVRCRLRPIEDLPEECFVRHESPAKKKRKKGKKGKKKLRLPFSEFLPHQ